MLTLLVALEAAQTTAHTPEERTTERGERRGPPREERGEDHRERREERGEDHRERREEDHQGDGKKI